MLRLLRLNELKHIVDRCPADKGSKFRGNNDGASAQRKYRPPRPRRLLNSAVPLLCKPFGAGSPLLGKNNAFSTKTVEDKVSNRNTLNGHADSSE